MLTVTSDRDAALPLFKSVSDLIAEYSLVRKLSNTLRRRDRSSISALPNRNHQRAEPRTHWQAFAQMFVHRGRLRPGTVYPRRGFPAQWLDLVQDRSGGRWHYVYGHLARVTGRLPEGETKLQAAGSASARPMATCAGRSRLAGPVRDPAGQRPRCREPDTERHHDDRSSDELRAHDPPTALRTRCRGCRPPRAVGHSCQHGVITGRTGAVSCPAGAGRGGIAGLPGRTGRVSRRRIWLPAPRTGRERGRSSGR